MRKLDELMQDIPPELLLPPISESIVKEDKTVRRETSRPGEAAAVRSGLPGAAIAVIAAVAAAVVLGVSMKLGHSVDTAPGGEPEVSGYPAGEVSSESQGSVAETDPANHNAKLLYNAMRSYLEQNPNTGIGSEGVLFVNLSDYDGEHGSIGLVLETTLGRDFSGMACFLFDGGKLTYAQFLDYGSSSPEVEIFPAYNGRETIGYLGRSAAQ